ncbi:MAG: carboxylating nicotinate-nucleotide diphosphorylase [Candidatus Edwardsbacteria bacterium]
MSLEIEKIRPLIRRALREDIGKGDITSNLTVSSKARALGIIMAKEEGILAGLQVAIATFQTIDKTLILQPQSSDGTKIGYGDVVLSIQGKALSILKGERVALNFLQRLSGIATFTAKFVTIIEGTKAKILDTRKTTPGLRLLEKAAVRTGGGENHRFGLDDMILIKSNHIEIAGGISETVKKIKSADTGQLFIEIETKNLSEVQEALQAGVDCLMLDNMSVEMIKEAVKMVQNVTLEGIKKPFLEASGKINLENIRAIAETGVDYISIGMLTHSAPALDFSLRLKQLGN